MAGIKLRFDPSDNTLQGLFADPQTMAMLSPIEEQSPGDLYLIRDHTDAMIGFEVQFYQYAAGALSIEWETLPLLRPDGEPKQDAQQ